MSNYIDKVSIYGMMNRYASICSDNSFYKNKAKTQITVFNKELNNPDIYSKINYMYMDNSPTDNTIKYSSMDNIISVIDTADMFYDMPGKEYREIRGTYNKFKNKITVSGLTAGNKQQVLDMIEEWRYIDNGGMKYGWIEHAGIDKALVERFCNNENGIADECNGTVFYFNGKCIGYSIIEKRPSEYIDGIAKFNYLTRKVLSITRNITEYIDWYTFRDLGYNADKFLIDWGCSSGGVHWYKTHKWPLYKIEKKYFWKVNND